MNKVANSGSPLRIFAFSAVASVLILISVLVGLGAQALFITTVLAVIEITFSFDNAIINAKVLARLSKPWQLVFLTVGIVIAIFGMRVLFPVLIVVLTAHLGWHDVINLALHHPHEYAHHLQAAHASIAAFGGAFLLLLALNFFFDGDKKVHWLRGERLASKFTHWLAAPGLTVLVVLLLSLLPGNHSAGKTLTAGLLGAATYIAIQLLDALFAKLRGAEDAGGVGQTGLAALASLVYLEVLDASFSFDGVIGAFAITSDVILIAAGLGIGALWVRSMTVYMVRRKVLGQYIYIEHGAHYTVLALAVVLLTSVIWNISDFIPGVAGLAIIGSSIIASREAQKSIKKL